MAKLTALSVRSALPGRHYDGDGLYLNVQPGGARSWLLRVQVEGKRRDIGLGTADLSPRSMSKGDSSPIDIPLLQKKMLTLAEPNKVTRAYRRTHYALTSGRRLVLLVAPCDGEDLAIVMSHVIGRRDRQQAVIEAIERHQAGEA